MLINGFLEERQEGLCVDRRCDNPGVERCRLTFGVDLTEVEKEFEGVMSYGEIVGVPPIGLVAILRVPVFTAYHNLPIQRFSPLSRSSARFRIVINASAVPSRACVVLFVPSPGLLKRSCQKGFRGFSTLAH
jgi:hypothetical protein